MPVCRAVVWLSKAAVGPVCPFGFLYPFPAIESAFPADYKDCGSTHAWLALKRQGGSSSAAPLALADPDKCVGESLASGNRCDKWLIHRRKRPEVGLETPAQKWDPAICDFVLYAGCCSGAVAGTPAKRPRTYLYCCSSTANASGNAVAEFMGRICPCFSPQLYVATRGRQPQF